MASPAGTRERRSAIVTGGASGIGRGLAEALGERGVEVVVADRQAELAEEVAAGIRKRGGHSTVETLDVRDHSRFRHVVDSTVQRCGRLDYLFNNAGIGVSSEIKDYEPADWDDVLDVNLRGVAYGVQAAYPLMVSQGFGHIVNTASMAGLMPGGLVGSYAASKFGVVGLSRALRIEGARYGVRVSVVCPGVIRTPILRGGRYGRIKYDLDPERMDSAFERLGPLDPDEHARKVLRGVDRNRAIIIHPAWWRALWYLDRLSPWLSERVQAALYRRLLAELESMRADAGSAA